MAKQKRDREDLLRDGIAMVIRGRLWIDSSEVFLGFRRPAATGVSGAVSLYWDQDPVYQFNAQGHLRRVFLHGERLKAEHGRLLVLQQQRSSRSGGRRVALDENKLSDAEQRRILSDLEAKLQRLARYLESVGSLECVGLDVDEFRARVIGWLKDHGRPIRIADGPETNATE